VRPAGEKLKERPKDRHKERAKEPAKEPAMSRQWRLLDPKLKRAVRQSVAEWLAREYAPAADLPPELRALLQQMDDCAIR
jgi:hypothetical protein